jgi:hypothetical protein
MKIVITLEGGLIQDVKHSGKEDLEICILDFDTEGSDGASEIKLQDSTLALCNIHSFSTDKDDDFIDHFFKELKKVEE